MRAVCKGCFFPVVRSHLFQMTHRPRLPLTFTRKQKNQVFIFWFFCLRGIESEPSGYQGRRGDQRMPGADWGPLMTCESLEYSQKTCIFCVCSRKCGSNPKMSKLSTESSTADSVDYSSPGYVILSPCWYHLPPNIWENGQIMRRWSNSPQSFTAKQWLCPWVTVLSSNSQGYITSSSCMPRALTPWILFTCKL